MPKLTATDVTGWLQVVLVLVQVGKITYDELREVIGHMKGDDGTDLDYKLADDADLLLLRAELARMKALNG